MIRFLHPKQPHLDAVLDDDDELDHREKLQYQLTRADAQIKTEAELINYRVQWLLITQTFLFGAFFLKLPPGTPLARPMPIILETIGFVSAGLISLSIFSAFMVTWQRRALRQEVEEELRQCGYDHLSATSANGAINVFGALPPVGIAIMFVFVWAFIALTV